MKRNFDSKKDILRRLRIIKGHLKKVIEMVEEDKYCIDVLQQTSAVRNSLKKAESILLDSHLRSCVVSAIKKNKSGETIKELLEIFKKSDN